MQVLLERRIESPWWERFRLLAALVAVACVVLRVGWRRPLLEDEVLLAIEVATIAAYAISLIIPHRRSGRSVGSLLSGHPIECVLLGLVLIFFWLPPVLTFVAVALAVYQLLRVYMLIMVASLAPSWIFVATFASLILAGAFALKLPIATPPEAPITMVDALFTSTSAVCVTGLIVRDTSIDFTRAGHTILLILFQLGGLGIVMFGALAALAMGSSLSMRASRTFAGSTVEGHARPSTIRKLVIFITCATLLTELIGALTLYIAWPETWEGAPGMSTPADRAFHSVFFAVSAFCNAGFATSPNSLEGLRWHWTTHLVFVALVFIGGIGLPVLENLRAVIVSRVRNRTVENGRLVRINLHTKLVLIAALGVYLGGAAIIFVGRLFHGEESIGGALLDAHFLALGSRTAGFDTIPPVTMGPLSQFATMCLMFIGGGPGSTAGGIKLVAFSIILMTIWATLKGKDATEGLGRTIPEDLVRKSATLITLGAGVIAALTMALAVTEGAGLHGHNLSDLLFEVVSASSTVGLSTGVTPDLSAPGRIVIIIAMFAGRIGPLVLLVALVNVGAKRRPRREFATEAVVLS